MGHSLKKLNMQSKYLHCNVTNCSSVGFRQICKKEKEKKNLKHIVKKNKYSKTLVKTSRTKQYRMYSKFLHFCEQIAELYNEIRQQPIKNNTIRRLKRNITFLDVTISHCVYFKNSSSFI